MPHSDCSHALTVSSHAQELAYITPDHRSIVQFKETGCFYSLPAGTEKSLYADCPTKKSLGRMARICNSCF